MKVVFISPAFYPSIGGVETHVLSLSRELTRLGHSVTVLTEDKLENQQSNDDGDNEATRLKSIDESRFFTHKKLYQIDIFYFKFGQHNFFKKFKIWYILLKNYKLFKDADVIHAHDVFIWYFPLRFVLFNKRIFTTFHGYEGVFPPAEKAKQIRQWSKALSYGTINAGAFIEKWYGTKSDYVTYGGVKQIETQDSNADEKEKAKVSKLKILFIGRLEKDIGVQLYLDTLSKLKKMGVKFSLTVCGDGSFRSAFEQYKGDFGFVTNVSAYIKKADIVFSSSYLSMLQALACGKPIFAAYTNPLKHDYLRMSPFEKYIYVSGHSSDLAKKIARQQFDKKKIESGRRWANTQTWEKVAEMYLELWNKK